MLHPGYPFDYRGISGEHGYALALTATLGDPLRGAGGDCLTTPPHSL